MMIFLSLRVTADAEGGLKIRAHLRPVLQGFGGGQPPTSEPRYIPRHCLPVSPHLWRTVVLLIVLCWFGWQQGVAGKG